MTKREAIYWRNFIEKIIDEKVPYIKRSDVESRQISDFAKRFMVTITGQQYLPQGLFREFLEIFSTIPEIQEDIVKAQEEIRSWLKNLPVECTESDIYAMFEEYGSAFRMDAEDYIVVSRAVYADDEGYLVLPSPALDIERYIEVVTI